MPVITTTPHPLPVVSRRVLIGGFAASLALTKLPASQTNASFRREKPAPSLETMTDILQQLPGALEEMEDPILFAFVDLEAQWKILGLPAYDPATGSPGTNYLNGSSMLPLRMDPFLYALATSSSR